MARLYRFAARSFALIIAATLLLLTHSHAQAQRPIRIIWLHHSVGLGIIDGGNVRSGLTGLGYEFYDHGYNEEGLRLADSSSSGTSFDVPDDNTYPDGLSVVFGQDLNDPPDNTFSYLMQYDVIMVKSCFPTSNIADDAQLEADKEYYRMMARRTDTYPDKLFIIVTHPPQVPLSTNADEARRARALNDWLLSSEFQGGHANLYVFDLFGRLAGSDNLLRSGYRNSDDDGHPNDQANALIGPELVDFVDQAIHSAWGDAAPPPGSEPTVESVEVPPAEQSSAEQPEVIGGLDDFEAGADVWHGETDRPESVIECGADSALAHGGNAALQLRYEIAAEGWINCSRGFDALQNWSDATGISFWLRADTPDQWITLGVYSGPADAPSPFEVFFAVPEASLNTWSQVSFAWSDFKLADWADLSSLQEIDPAQITGYNFSLGTGEEVNKGIVWIDDVTLTGGGQKGSSIQATQAAEPEADEAALPTEEQAASESQPSKKLCGGTGAVLLLPLAAGAVILSRHRRSNGI